MKRTQIYSLASAIALAVAIGTVPAGAGQLYVGTDPVVTGPLELVTEGCSREEEKQGDTVVAIARYCMRFYKYTDTASLVDPTTGHGVLWLQTSVNPTRNNWCVTSANSDIRIPAGTTLIETRPRWPHTVSKVARQRTSLTIGTDVATTPASLSQWWQKRPRSFTPKMINDGNSFRLRWVGRTGYRVAFASAAEISWSVVDGPPETVSLSLTYDFVRDLRC